MTGGAAAAARVVEEDVQKAEPSAEQSTGRGDIYLFISRTSALNLNDNFKHLSSFNLCKKFMKRIRTV